jgi:hypothetical protein
MFVNQLMCFFGCSKRVQSRNFSEIAGRIHLKLRPDSIFFEWLTTAMTQKALSPIADFNL